MFRLYVSLSHQYSFLGGQRWTAALQPGRRPVAPGRHHLVRVGLRQAGRTRRLHPRLCLHGVDARHSQGLRGPAGQILPRDGELI